MTIEHLLYLSVAANVLLAFITARFFAAATERLEDIERLRAVLKARMQPFQTPNPQLRWPTIHANDKKDL
jgi:hypothetical protein